MGVYVYYEDGYADDGGVGLKRFDSRAEASRFIAERMKKVDRPDPADYTVIEGRPLTVRPVEFAVRVELD